MRIPVIKVRDKCRNEVHIVGSNSHDALIPSKGKIEYYNLQNGDGSGEGEGYGYEFEYEENGWYMPFIDFVTLEEFIEMSMKDIDENAKARIEFYKAYKTGVFDKVKEAQEDAGITYDSIGSILD